MSAEPMDCNELVELVTDYLEGTLDADETSRFDEHVLDCDGCENYLQQFRSTIDILGRATNEDLDPTVRARLLNDAFRGDDFV